MSRAPAALGLATRLARREVCRRPWRTLLIALLVALPVAGTVAATVLARTEKLSAAESWRLESGNADAVKGGGGQEPDSAVALPPGTQTVTDHFAHFQLLRTPAGDRSRVYISDLAAAEPMVADIVTLEDGKLPSAEGEVLLSRSVARDLEVQIGDSIELDRPTTRTVVVTGIGHMSADLGQRLVLVAPGSDLLGAPERFRQSTTYLEAPASLTSSERDAWAQAVRESGYALSPTTFPHLQIAQASSANAAVRWIWVIGGLVLTVACIVIGSAFASGARRQLATLGQLAANGAGPRVLRRTLLLQGTWTGLVGSVGGLGLGLVALAVLNPYRDNLFNREATAYLMRPVDLIPIVVMGTLATTLAALVPARTTSRVPVLAALAGRRPLGRVPRRLTVAGFVAIACGLALLCVAVLGSTGKGSSGGDAWTASAVIGGIAILLGASAVAPGLVGLLEPLASRLQGPWRFAARSLVRQRTRTGGVVSAVCATSALAVMASALALGSIAGDNAQHSSARDNELQLISERVTSVVTIGNRRQVRAATPVEVPADLITSLQEAMPSLRVIPTTVVTSETTLAKPQAENEPRPKEAPPSLATRPPAIADTTTLEAYKLDESALRTLRENGAVVIDDGMGRDDVLPTSVVLGGRTIELTKVTADDIGLLRRILITPELAAELNLTSAPGPVILRAPKSLTTHELDLLREIGDDYTFATSVPAADGTFVNTGFAIMETSGAPPAFVLEAILSGVALVFALFVIAVSLALAAAETRDERDVLAVVGAAPATMRRTSAHKAVLLALFGAALAIPVGFLPVIVFVASDRSSTPFLIFPWRTVGMLLVVVPVLIGLMTSGASALALRLKPVRVSTMTFD
jgi:putative ABC transport system permease protein